MTRTERIQKASRHRREHEKEELKQIILKEAAALFLEQGYDRFSMRQLAERIGYSVATLYLYFRDKDALLFTVVDDGFARFIQELRTAVSSHTDSWERLQALGNAYIRFGLNNPVYYQLMFMWRVDYLTTNAEGHEKPRLEGFGILREAVQYAIDSGSMLADDTQSTSDMFWASMHGIVALAIGVPSMFDQPRVEKLVEVAQETLQRAFERA